MSKRIWGACLALAMGWVSASGPRSEAKPPDLPVSPDVQCNDGRVFEGAVTEHGAVCVEHCAEIPASGVIADLSWLEILLSQGESSASNTNTPTPTSGADSDRNAQIDRYRQAQRIYGLGIEYQQTGNLMKARTCFQEAHLLSPETRYGRLAIERLHYLESNLPTGAEEAEEPPSGRQSRPTKEQRYQEMMRETAPLGTIPLRSF